MATFSMYLVLTNSLVFIRFEIFGYQKVVLVPALGLVCKHICVLHVCVYMCICMFVCMYMYMCAYPYKDMTIHIK